MNGPFTRLPQPPRDRNGISPFELAKWFDKLWMILSGLPGIGWDIISKTASKLTDIETRYHSMLQQTYGADVTNTGIVIEDAVHVKHVSDAQAQTWENAALQAQIVMAELAVTSSPPMTDQGDTQALQWM